MYFKSVRFDSLIVKTTIGLEFFHFRVLSFSNIFGLKLTLMRCH